MGVAQRTDFVQWIDSLRAQNLCAGVQKISFGPHRPALGTFQAHGLREARDVGLFKDESGQGRLQIRWRGVGTPAGGAIDHLPATLQEDLLQQRPFPDTIRSRTPESQILF